MIPKILSVETYVNKLKQSELTPKRIKITHVTSKNNSIFGVILIPDREEKELFFRSKNDPKFGVKLGVKATPKRGYPVSKIFTPFLEL